MRVFIGIVLSQSVKDSLFDLQQQVKPYSVKGKFTSATNFHLTLQFIGEATAAEIDVLKTVVSSVSEDSIPFDLSLNHIGEFSKKNKSILWAGPESVHFLNKLYDKLHQAFLQHNIEMEKGGYTPHITLVRNVVLKKSFEQMNQELNWNPITVTIDNITLFESTRISDQLVYLPIEKNKDR